MIRREPVNDGGEALILPGLNDLLRLGEIFDEVLDVSCFTTPLMSSEVAVPISSYLGLLRHGSHHCHEPCLCSVRCMIILSLLSWPWCLLLCWQLHGWGKSRPFVS